MKGVSRLVLHARRLVQGAQRLGRDPHAGLAAKFVHQSHLDQVRLPAALGMALAVRDVVAGDRTLTSYRANLGHGSYTSATANPAVSWCGNAWLNSPARMAAQA